MYRRSRVQQRKFFTSIPNRQREIEVQTLDQIWVGDVTYLRVAGQWWYLATVMDCFSRRILGWSPGQQRDAALTQAALLLALRKRTVTPGLVFHSDRGMDYAAYSFRDTLERHNIVQSMNRPGRLNDNAHMESLFHSMNTESFYGRTFQSGGQLRRALAHYIRFYNHRRLHSGIRYLPPVAFEQRFSSQTCVN